MGTHPSKVQGKREHKQTQHKEKMKIKNQQKLRKNPYANKTHGYEAMINDNKEDLRRKSCCLSQIGQ